MKITYREVKNIFQDVATTIRLSGPFPREEDKEYIVIIPALRLVAPGVTFPKTHHGPEVNGHTITLTIYDDFYDFDQQQDTKEYLDQFNVYHISRHKRIGDKSQSFRCKCYWKEA